MTPRHPCLAAFLLAAVIIGGCGQERPPVPVTPLLDGTRRLDEAGLARLALARAHLGARWLTGIVRPDGSFAYWYRPREDRFDNRSYNAIRHAGTTYSLFQVYGATRDPRVLAAGERATRFIDRHSIPVAGSNGRAYVYRGRTQLGGQALALVALLERRQVTRDRRYDGLVRDLARFLRVLEVRRQPGRFYFTYMPATGKLALTPASDYYPGEALLALTRMAQQFPDAGYDQLATRTADYLVFRRDGNIAAAGRVPREDHWLTLALSELYRRHPRPAYRSVVYLEAGSMRANQHRSTEDGPQWIGASMAQQPINYTSTATKGEALVAAWSLARFAGDQPRSRTLALAAQRNLQFQMRTQYTAANTRHFPRPRRVIGAWPQDPDVDDVRVDFVQHNISGLVTGWSMMVRGDLAIARPLAPGRQRS